VPISLKNSDPVRNNDSKARPGGFERCARDHPGQSFSTISAITGICTPAVVRSAQRPSSPFPVLDAALQTGRSVRKGAPPARGPSRTTSGRRIVTLSGLPQMRHSRSEASSTAVREVLSREPLRDLDRNQPKGDRDHEEKPFHPRDPAQRRVRARVQAPSPDRLQCVDPAKPSCWPGMSGQ
jgi:hypothetical protein